MVGIRSARRLAVLLAVAAGGIAAVSPDRRSADRPASATAPPIRGLAFAGPVVAGGAVLWGEEFPDGSLAVVRRLPRGSPEIVHRMRAPDDRDARRSFVGLPGALSASAKTMAFGVYESRVVQEDDDSVTTEGQAAAYSGWPSESFKRLVPQCEDASNVATAVRAYTVALAQSAARCDGVNATRVWVFERDAAPRLLYATSNDVVIRQIRLAGRWIAWSEAGRGGGASRVQVADIASGTVTDALSPAELGVAGSVHAFDIGADGSVAVLAGNAPECRPACVATRDATDAATRVVTSRAYGWSVALESGRVAFVSARAGEPRALLLGAIGPGRLRRVHRFPARVTPVGDLALTSGQMAWGEARGDRSAPNATGRVRRVTLR